MTSQLRDTNDGSLTLSKSVLRAIFLRKGGAGFNTRPFEQFANDIQGQMMSQMLLLEGEEPVIAYFQSASEWVLITTKRVIWFADGKLSELNNSEVSDATLDLARDARLGAKTKKDLRHLVIETSSAEKHRIRLEPGPPFFAVLNVIKHIAAVS